jgi:hypothetical protein
MTAVADPNVAPDELLFAGGSCGLLVLCERGEQQMWSPLMERAEDVGLSGLITPDASGATRLNELGVTRICAVAARHQTRDALRLAIEGSCHSIVLLSPYLDGSDSTREAIREVRAPRLLMAGWPPEDVQQVRALDALSIGQVAMRFFPVDASGAGLLDSPLGHLVSESTWLFAARTIGRDASLDATTGALAPRRYTHD